MLVDIHFTKYKTMKSPKMVNIMIRHELKAGPHCQSFRDQK
jgi:hypothetical protein